MDRDHFWLGTGTPSSACFGRLKELRRIATRFDRLAGNFLAAVCFAATLWYWV
jgi:transposase